MRVAIVASNGCLTSMQFQITNYQNSIQDSISSLQKVSNKIDNLTLGTARMGSAADGVNKRIKTAEHRLSEIQETKKKIDSFLNNTIDTDRHVQSAIFHNQAMFFESHEWLRPPKPKNAFESWLDQRIENWNKFWGSVGEALSVVWNGICNFVKEHWVEIVVGLVAITVGAALMAITGGGAAAFLPLLLGGLKAAALSAAAGGAFSSALALFTGDDPLKAFGDGFASGFMIGGILYGISGVFTAIKNVSKMKEIAKVKPSGSAQQSAEHYKNIFDKADNYKLTQDTYKGHILDRHGSNSIYRNKSLFNSNFDIKAGIDSTLRGDQFILRPNTSGRPGYIFERIFDSPIGKSSNGRDLYTLKVVMDELGNIVTAFPK